MTFLIYFIVYGSFSEWSERWGESESHSGSAISSAAAISFIAIYAWSFFDAARVAKIKNMHLRRDEVSFYIEPYFATGVDRNINFGVSGLSFKFVF